MLNVVPYEFNEIKTELKKKAIENLGISDAEFEGSSVSQLIELLAYANTMNNSNITFAINEMFITQAQDRRNVIKHASEMGYTYKRKVSYQYKIKLQVTKTGEITLNKYSTFSSGNNNYVFLDESISDVYGTYAYIKPLINENNNNQDNLYISKDTEKDNYIVNENNSVYKILKRGNIGSEKLLLEVIKGEKPNILSNINQDVYITDNSRQLGYRNLTKIGTIDTFLTDNINNKFRIQITQSDNFINPFETQILHNSSIIYKDNNFILNINTDFKIYSINSLKLSNDTNISPLSIIYNNGDTNIIIPNDLLNITENYNTDISFKITLNNTEISGINSINIIIDTINYNITDFNIINNIITLNNKIENKIEQNKSIINGEISLNKNIVNIVNILLINQLDNSNIIIPSDKYSFNNNIITFIDNIYDNYKAEIDYNYYLEFEKSSEIKINYDYYDDLTKYSVILDYNYIYGKDGYLSKNIFFGDFRGEIKENENDYNKDNMKNGWNGFYASSYDEETNVLFFDISVVDSIDENILNKSRNQYYHNTYVSINGENSERIDKVIISPFKKTRFSFCSPIIDKSNNEIIDYSVYNKDTTFASINLIEIKDTLEIIVKEGNLKLWNEETPESIDLRNQAILNGLVIPEKDYINKYLSININQDMIDAGHFNIDNLNIENNGIELFITRLLEDGKIEVEKPWIKRDYLLAEKINSDETTFVIIPDSDYENYLKIYTKYAGTGIPLSLDMKIKLNILESNGSNGKTNNLILSDNENFKTINYYNEPITPSILHIEGSDIEETDSIRNNAPLFSNTANRAVTKKDFQTICEAQPYIKSSEIWGGEEEVPTKKPGIIFFSFIPYSKPNTFIKNGFSYLLKDINNIDLFFTKYYQITGKETYSDLVVNSSDKNVLFNILNNYKIITLELNYIKPIYIDFSINVKVLKYKFGLTIDQTNQNIFSYAENFFKKNIEKFNSTFFKSTMFKYLDETLGNDYGLLADVKISVDLYDDLNNPDNGTFINITKNDLIPDSLGIIGNNDNWQFKLPLDYPIENLFEDDTIVNNIITRKGRMLINNITTCNTKDFIVSGDNLYMELNDNTFNSIDINGNIEEILPSQHSTEIEISIIYERNNIKFKVGSYLIYKREKIIFIEINTHFKNNINSQAFVTENYKNKTVEDIDINGNIIFRDYDIINDLNKKVFYNSNNQETLIETNNIKYFYEDSNKFMFKDINGNDLYEVIDCPLSRSDFINIKRTLLINPKDSNISFKRNVFSRFKEINFI